MKRNQYISVADLAKILGISRIAVHKKIKKGQIKAVRIGRAWAIPRKYLDEIAGTALNDEDKKILDEAVERTVKDYGEVLKLLGKE